MKIRTILQSVASVAIVACSNVPTNVKQVVSLPPIYPNYVGVTIPTNIAPLNFALTNTDVTRISVRVRGAHGEIVDNNANSTNFDIDEWQQLLQQSKGDSLVVSVCALCNDEWLHYKDFSIYVSADTLSAYGLTYRRIAPGYVVYGHMGIYQRNISNFDEKPIFDNNELSGSCVNCHTSNRTSANNYLFHVRGENGATVLEHDGQTELLNTLTDQTVGSLVYPYWHPDGRYVAFSTNVTRQSFHEADNKRIEVFDNQSDVAIYDTQTHQLLLSSLLNGTEHTLETFPTFSTNGDKLYFCSAQAVSIPDELKDLRYRLCQIRFDASSRQFGTTIDTLIDLTNRGLSISHPRPSYDGRFVMFTTANYGTFPIWHPEADLWLYDVATDSVMPMPEVNSKQSDSFHNWSADSRWFVFTSRRDDGLYTRLYIAHVDTDGHASKPFLLPQINPKEYYDNMLYSYNTPDFSDAPISFDVKHVASMLSQTNRQSVIPTNMQ